MSYLKCPKFLIIGILISGALGFAGFRTWSYYHKPALREEVRALYPEYVSYCLKNYESHGLKNPKWDRSLRVLIDEVAYDWYRDGATCRPRLLNQFSSLASAGCNDPLFLWLASKYWWDRNDAPRAEENFAGAHLAMRGSDYDPVFKFMTAVSAAKEAGRDAEKQNLSRKLRDDAFEYLIVTISSPEIPTLTIAAPAEAYFDWAEDHDAKDVMKQRTEQLHRAIAEHRPNDALAMRLLGRAYIDLAWSARGSGYAASVTSEGWKDFSNYLDIAEALLERSWAFQPTSRAACHMLSVELGQGRGRDRMELWFQRAMALNPTSRLACGAKLTYLRPRWHGSQEEMLKFGEECARNPAWSGEVPLMLAQAVAYYVTDHSESEQPRLWQQPEVWGRMRESYTTYLAQHPDDAAVQHEYLTNAHRAGAWKDFGRQLKKMGSVNLQYISATQFQSMVQDYTDHL